MLIRIIALCLISTSVLAVEAFTPRFVHTHGLVSMQDENGKELLKYRILAKLVTSSKSVEMDIIRYDNDLRGRRYLSKLERITQDTGLLQRILPPGTAVPVKLFYGADKSFAGFKGKVKNADGTTYDITSEIVGTRSTTKTYDLGADGKIHRQAFSETNEVPTSEYSRLLKRLKLYDFPKGPAPKTPPN